MKMPRETQQEWAEGICIQKILDYLRKSKQTEKAFSDEVELYLFEKIEINITANYSSPTQRIDERIAELKKFAIDYVANNRFEICPEAKKIYNRIVTK